MQKEENYPSESRAHKVGGVTCGSPLVLPSSESDCWSGSFSSPWKWKKKIQNDQRRTFVTSCTSRRVVGILKGGRSASHLGSRRRPQWSVSSRGAACVHVWSGAETCPLPPSPPPFCPFLSGKNDGEKVNQVPQYNRTSALFVHL